MSMLGWMSRRPPQPTDAKANAKPASKRPKIDPEVVRERARKNSPWRFDDGPSRRPVGTK